MSDKLVPDKLGRHGHVTTGAGRDFPQFPTVYIHSTGTVRDRQVNHNFHLNQSLYASCTREYATVFDPQTKERANQKPRVLICDGSSIFLTPRDCLLGSIPSGAPAC